MVRTNAALDATSDSRVHPIIILKERYTMKANRKKCAAVLAVAILSAGSVLESFPYIDPDRLYSGLLSLT
jgi:hypothetical protein